MTTDNSQDWRNSKPFPEGFKSVLDIKRVGGGYARAQYEVTLIEGEWLGNEDLVTVCDNYQRSPWSAEEAKETGPANHFGGSVGKIDGNPAARYVTVYTD